MRWFVRLVTAGTLSAMAVAALTWAGWPRPKSVTRIDSVARVSFAGSLPGPASRYRLVQQGEFGNCDAGFWFLDPDGNLRGPWRPGRPMLLLGFDAAGRLLACSLCGPGFAGDHGGFALARYDPETGHAEIVLSLDGPAPPDFKLSRDHSTLALASTDPLVFDLYDVVDGRKRTRLTFPSRAGGLNAWHDSQPKLAAFAWELSPDGRQLLLAEAWDGLQRLTPQASTFMKSRRVVWPDGSFTVATRFRRRCRANHPSSASVPSVSRPTASRWRAAFTAEDMTRRWRSGPPTTRSGSPTATTPPATSSRWTPPRPTTGHTAWRPTAAARYGFADSRPPTEGRRRSTASPI